MFHWNLNNVCAHNFIKLSVIRTYIAANQCDTSCLSETFLDSGILNENKYAKVCNFISLYISPNQSLEEFETFADNLDLNLDTISKNNPFLIVLLGNLNAKSSKWYKNGGTSYESTKIDCMTSQFGMQQLVNEPTHILPPSSSCIDLIFVSEPKLVMES